MSLNETFLFYLLIGSGVSAAVLLGGEKLSRGVQVFQSVTAVLFWPVYLPVLLRRPQSAGENEATDRESATCRDGMSVAISQVEAELDSALRSLDGWAEGPLSREHDRLSELRGAWHLQAERVRELDRLLSQPEFIREGEAPAEPQTRVDSEAAAQRELRPPFSNRIQHSEQARRENIKRLTKVRKQLHNDLMGTLAWVRELVTMIHLAKFTGAPPSRAEELVAQIAASVEGLSEVTNWQDESELVGTVF